jgi:hypothetical protein
MPQHFIFNFFNILELETTIFIAPFDMNIKKYTKIKLMKKIIDLKPQVYKRQCHFKDLISSSNCDSLKKQIKQREMSVLYTLKHNNIIYAYNIFTVQ